MGGGLRGGSAREGNDQSRFVDRLIYQDHRSLLISAMETLRVYRPRVILHGPVGMGQTYVGPAALHHLEGYHVQSLELGTLMSDSTRVSYLSQTLHTHANYFTDGRSSYCSTIR